MSEPFMDGSEGKWMTNPSDVEKIMDHYWKSGFQIHLHTNGDKAMALVLENVERLSQKYPRKNHKTTIEHAGYFTKDQADILASLGCYVSAQPYYHFALKNAYSKQGLGLKKASQITPLKWLEDRNVLTALHSDFTMAPAQPLLQMWIAVNRKTVEDVGEDGKDGEDGGVPDPFAISVQEAFKAVTINVIKIKGLFTLHNVKIQKSFRHSHFT